MRRFLQVFCGDNLFSIALTEMLVEFLKYPSPDAPGPTDSDKLATTCARNWRAAQAQDGKKVSQVFDETGIFLACCRHGLVDIMVDMIQSGELYVFVLVHGMCFQGSPFVGYHSLTH